MLRAPEWMCSGAGSRGSENVVAYVVRSFLRERRIGHATDFLHTNYAQPIDLDEIARAACLSKYHFLRLFALVHGMTPFSYLQRKRARVALRLLRTTAYTVAEVACSVGFSQRTTALRQIRRWTGLRPLQIRTGEGSN